MNFLALLTLIFITLKLMGIIAWSWWLVLLPIIPMLVLTMLGFTYLIAIISAFFVDTFRGHK